MKNIFMLLQISNGITTSNNWWNIFTPLFLTIQLFILHYFDNIFIRFREVGLLLHQKKMMQIWSLKLYWKIRTLFLTFLFTGILQQSQHFYQIKRSEVLYPTELILFKIVYSFVVSVICGLERDWSSRGTSLTSDGRSTGLWPVSTGPNR